MPRTTPVPYLEKPTESTDKVLWCPDTFDLASFPANSADRLASAKPIWVSPYGSVACDSEAQWNHATGNDYVDNDLQVATLKAVYLWIETNIAFASGTFQIYWGWLTAVADANAAQLYAHHDYSLTNGQTRGTLIEVPYASFNGAKAIYKGKKGIVAAASWDGVGAGGTGKVKVGVCITRERL